LEIQDYWIYPVDSKPCGLTYSEWSIKWWRWLSGIPESNNPSLDSKGRPSILKQNASPVYFLCQTLESTLPYPRRRVEVPPKYNVFMPIINWISFSEEATQDPELMKVEAKKRMDAIGALEFRINGKKIREDLRKYRVTSDVFECILPRGNIFRLPPGRTQAVSDGYWLFFRVSQQNMSISSLASCSSGVTNIGVHYDLIVDGVQA
jgi:hypothetical protein